MRWTKETIQKEANKFKSKTEWSLKSRKSYQSAINYNGGSDLYAAHMIPMKIKWTSKLIQDEANKFKSRIDWKTYSKKSYAAARVIGGIDKYAGHMKGNIKWSVELIRLEANKYLTRSEWRLKSRKSYEAAVRIKGVSSYADHMKPVPWLNKKEEPIIVQEKKFIPEKILPNLQDVYG